MSISDTLNSSNFQFISTPLHLQCTLCHKILNNACYGSCGCRYCRSCISQYLNGVERICPSMRKGDHVMLNINRNVMTDIAANREVSELIVKCFHDHCDWTGPMNSIDEHVKVCSKASVNCIFAEIGCQSSGLLNEDLKEHINKDVVMHSRLMVTFVKDVTNDMKIKMDNVENRLSFNEMEYGNLLKKSIQELDDRWRVQNKVLCDEIAALKEQQVHLCKSKSELECLLHESQSHFQQQITAFQKQFRDNEEYTKSMKKEIESLRQKLVDNVKNMNKSIIKLETSVRAQKSDVQKPNVAAIKNPKKPVEKPNSLPADHSINEPVSLNSVNVLNLCEFRWIIDGAKDKYNACEFARSDVFCTIDRYHLRLRLSFKPTQFILWCQLVKGDQDNELRWPFPHDISLAVLNQTTNKSLASCKLNYATTKKDAGKARYEQPKAKDNTWIDAFTKPIDSAKLAEWTKDDILLICCSVTSVHSGSPSK